MDELRGAVISPRHQAAVKPPRSSRLEFVDGLRGIAVLFMLVLHSAHGWLHPDFKSGSVGYWINSIGGMAAPLFFLLTGIGLGLRVSGKRPPSARAELARGAGLIVLGYLLRVQMWQLDRRAFMEPSNLAAGALLAGGYLLVYRGWLRFGRAEPAAGTLAMGVAASGVGLAAALHVAPASFPNLLRFDVLQGLGLTGILLAAPLARFDSRWARGLSAATLGALILVFTHPLRAWVPGPLPAAIAAPIAYWPNPAGGAPWAMFPLFPWAAYAAFGALVGGYLAHVGSARLLPLGVLGAALALLTSENITWIVQTLAVHPALTQPMRVGYRLGLGLALLWAAGGLAQLGGWPQRWLVELGRASLWVYWLHLEFTFGIAAKPIHAKLNLSQWALHLGALVVAMMAVAQIRLALRSRTKQARQIGAGAPAANLQ